MLRILRAAPVAAIAAFALASPAAAVIVTDIVSAFPLPAGTAWSTLPSENTGTAEITTAAARSGNGSIELRGDRTRVQTGYQYGAAAAGASNMGLLSDVVSLTFDWMVALDSVAALG